MTDPKPPLAKRVQQLKAIYASFAAAIFVYILVLSFNLQKPSAAGDANVLRPALMLAAVMFAGASIWWRRRAIRAMQAEAIIDGCSFERLRTNCIITWSLSESVAVMGLVIGLLAGDLGAFAPYAAAALALLTVHRPTAWPLWPKKTSA